MPQYSLGFRYLLDGFILITQPGLKRFILIPLLINLLLFVGLFFLSHYFMEGFNHWLADFLPAWLKWLGILLWLLFFIGFFIIFIYFFVMFANLIAAPFNGLLAEKVANYLTGDASKEQGLLSSLHDVPRMFARQFMIIGYYLPRAFFILILFFIPLVQTIAPILSFLFHAWFMTFTYLDYPTDNQRVPLHDVRAWMRGERYVSLTFGATVLIASMIPLINLIVMPAAVAGATKLWLEKRARLD